MAPRTVMQNLSESFESFLIISNSNSCPTFCPDGFNEPLKLLLTEHMSCLDRIFVNLVVATPPLPPAGHGDGRVQGEEGGGASSKETLEKEFNT